MKTSQNTHHLILIWLLDIFFVCGLCLCLFLSYNLSISCACCCVLLCPLLAFRGVSPGKWLKTSCEIENVTSKAVLQISRRKDLKVDSAAGSLVWVCQSTWPRSESFWGGIGGGDAQTHQNRCKLFTGVHLCPVRLVRRRGAVFLAAQLTPPRHLKNRFRFCGHPL